MVFLRFSSDLCRDPDRVEEENWAIRWMPWHVFCCRDNRDKNRCAVQLAVDIPAVLNSFASLQRHPSRLEDNVRQPGDDTYSGGEALTVPWNFGARVYPL